MEIMDLKGKIKRTLCTENCFNKAKLFTKKLKLFPSLFLLVFCLFRRPMEFS